MSARERILSRVRKGLEPRDSLPHPGGFGGWRADAPPPPVEAFIEVFTGAGGEAVRVDDEAAAAAWLGEFCLDFAGAAVGAQVPRALHPPLDEMPAETAEVGVSMAVCGVGETGSLMLSAADGRRAQLLPQTNVVFVRAADIHATLREALTAAKEDLPSALGLHSGPSKSADIGQILVRGVHGPGRIIAVLIGESP